MRHFLQAFFNPDRSLARFILGTAAFTVAVQIIYDIFKEPFGLYGGLALAITLLGIVIIIIVVDYRRLIQSMQPRQECGIDPHSGLILLISPKNTEVPLAAVNHHSSKLKYCWLIATEESKFTAEEVKNLITHKYKEVKVNNLDEFIVEPENIESTYNIVNRIYKLCVEDLELSETDVVSDITGGVKPMTAGMALACFSPNRKMQYLKTVRDDHGVTIPGQSPIPIQITLEKDHNPGRPG